MKTRSARKAKKLIILGVRVDDEWLMKLTQWISDHEPGMSRPEAIRRMVEIGLSKSAPSERLRGARTSVSTGAGLKAKGK